MIDLTPYWCQGIRPTYRAPTRTMGDEFWFLPFLRILISLDEEFILPTMFGPWQRILIRLLIELNGMKGAQEEFTHLLFAIQTIMTIYGIPY